MALVTSGAAAELAALQKRTDDRLAQQGAGNAAISFAKDVKQSLLFQYDWAELLSAAPLCISMMGSCYVAATSPQASGMSLKECEPKGGFQKIKYPQLRACLTQVSDSGRMAFIEAEKKMDLISSQAASIGQWLTQIGTYLAYLPAPDAAANLNKKLNLLKEGSDNCLRYSQDIEGKFKDWLELVCEVHQVTVAKEEMTSIGQKENSIKAAGLNVESEMSATSLAHADEAAKLMKENMDSAKKMFEKAADAIPSPLQQVGLQFVSSLTQTATTVVSQGLPMLMGGGILGGVLGGALNGSKAQESATGNKKGSKGSKGSKSSKGNKAVSSQLQVAVTDPNDPAYLVAVQIKDSIIFLATILGAEQTTGVDWEHLDPAPVAGKAPQSGLTYVASMLGYALQSTQWADSPASQELKGVLTKLNDVVKSIKAETAKDQQLTAQKAAADSPLVKGWQQSALDGKAKVTQLVTTASSLPGSSPGGAPFIGKTPSAASSTDQSGLNAALQSAQEKVNVTEAAYLSTQQNYQKSIENRSKVEAELARIKASLKGLELSQAKLDEIKKILVQCIGMVIQMKQQITNLVRFFSALSAMVEHVVKTQVRDFLDQVDTAKTCLIGNISLSDMCRQELYTTTLMVQAYFSLFNTIANMYKKISVDHIMPGVFLCDELSRTTTDPDATDRKLEKLNEFTDNAQKAIQEEVSKAQKTMTATLEQRVTSVQAETKLLPAPSPAVRLAIEAGKSEVTSAVATGIANQENPIVAADCGVSMDALD